MAVIDKNVFESVLLDEAVTKNLHDAFAGDALSLSDLPDSQYTYLKNVETMFLMEKLVSAGSIYQEPIADSLVFIEQIYPKVLICNAADIFNMRETIISSGSSVYNFLTFLETLTAVKGNIVKETLIFVESLTMNIIKHTMTMEVFALSEGLSGFMISDDFPTSIAPPFCPPPSPLVFGIIMQETPTGLIDGSNRTFGISVPPQQINSLQVYVNGVLQRLVEDYTFAGTTITFTIPSTPQVGDTMIAYYLK